MKPTPEPLAAVNTRLTRPSSNDLPFLSLFMYLLFSFLVAIFASAIAAAATATTTATATATAAAVVSQLIKPIFVYGQAWAVPCS